ncbi:MAG: type II secretion system F family protein [Candidatus Ancaeobacter aquaticus]|nr:type II secretion system F family protein [Candidatus Ancaeobacter aquaticus]
MPLYDYKAKDKIGNEITGTIESQSEKTAIDILRDKNIFVVTISSGDKKRPVKRGKKVKRADIVTFSRQLSTMANAGLPILESLNILHNQSENQGMQDMLQAITRKVESGYSLSEAFRMHEKVFGSLFVNMVNAGESSGKLPTILKRVASYMESVDKMNRKIKSAMMYPTIVTGACLCITLFLIIKVIPVFEEMYADFGGTLPAPTQVLIAFSNFLREWSILFIIGVVAIFFIMRKLLRTEMGQVVFDTFKLKVPVFGLLIKKVVISRFAKTLSVLVESGIPILQALDIIKGVVGNKVVEAAVDKTTKAVREGESIAVPLSTCPVFPIMVVKMIEVGEKTGNLEEMLEKMSEYYDDEVDAAVMGLTSIIEPLLMVVLGVVIGGIVICMFLPIFKISTMIH